MTSSEFQDHIHYLLTQGAFKDSVGDWLNCHGPSSPAQPNIIQSPDPTTTSTNLLYLHTNEDISRQCLESRAVNVSSLNCDGAWPHFNSTTDDDLLDLCLLDGYLDWVRDNNVVELMIARGATRLASLLNRILAFPSQSHNPSARVVG